MFPIFFKIMVFLYQVNRGANPDPPAYWMQALLRMGLVVIAAGLSYLHQLNEQTEKGNYICSPSHN